jgi:hypothetical protein
MELTIHRMRGTSRTNGFRCGGTVVQYDAKVNMIRQPVGHSSLPRQFQLRGMQASPVANVEITVRAIHLHHASGIFGNPS